MGKKHTEKERREVTYVVTREFVGERTMQQAFEDVVQHQLQAKLEEKVGRNTG